MTVKVKDVIVSTLYMLNLTTEAAQVDGLTGAISNIATRMVRLFNLVAAEVGEEYRRGSGTKSSYGLYDDIPEFYGITGRMLAYGVAAEYCIVEGMAEAVTWDKRYKDALAAAKKKAARMNERKFY